MRPDRYALAELSRVSGIPYCTVYNRWHAGDRGERLTRPVDESKRRRALRLDPPAQPPPPQRNSDLVAIKRDHLSRKQAKEQERAQAEQRRAERQQRIAQVRQQLLEAMQRPLIDARLLTTGERELIRARIGGQQRWKSMGANLL